MTKAQQVYERVEALVASGARKADAFRQVADELGIEFNSARGAYYSHSRTLGGTPSRRTRTKRDTTEAAIESATAVLQRAIDAIDAEVGVARERADQATANYEHLRDSAEERKAAIQAKIDALTS